MSKVDLILLDWEGCGCRGKGYLWDIDPLAEIQKMVLSKSIPPVVLCTGRPQPYAEAVLQVIGGLRSGGVPSVVENGCFLYDPAPGMERMIPHPKLAPMMEQWSVLRGQVIAALEGLANIEPGKEVCISANPLPGTTVEELFEVVRTLLTALGGWAWNIAEITHSKSAVDITPRGVNKAAGVKYLSEILDISLYAMAGVGDSRGDLPWLDIIGFPCAPANATPDVQEICRDRGGYVSPREYGWGVVDVVREIQIHNDQCK